MDMEIDFLNGGGYEEIAFEHKNPYSITWSLKNKKSIYQKGFKEAKRSLTVH